MIRLKGIPEESYGLLLDVHIAIYENARVLLRENGFVIQEEALYRAGKLKFRKQIQWNAIRAELQEATQRQLLSISRAQFREQIENKFEPLSVVGHVRDYLRIGRGNGNETAGYSFANWKRDITERKIAARRNTATGLDKSADLLVIAMDEGRPMLPASANSEATDA